MVFQVASKEGFMTKLGGFVKVTAFVMFAYNRRYSFVVTQPLLSAVWRYVQ